MRFFSENIFSLTIWGFVKYQPSFNINVSYSDTIKLIQYESGHDNIWIRYWLSLFVNPKWENEALSLSHYIINMRIYVDQSLKLSTRI